MLIFCNPGRICLLCKEICKESKNLTKIWGGRSPMMMTRPIKFSLLPTSSPVAVFLLHLLEANPAFVRLQTMILSFTVNLCDPRILIWDVTSWKDRSDIYTTDPDLSDKINFRLFCVFLQCSQPCLVFFLLLNVCDHALFTEPALCCCSLRTRTRAGAPLHTSTQSFRFSEKLMYLH